MVVLVAVIAPVSVALTAGVAVTPEGVQISTQGVENSTKCVLVVPPMCSALAMLDATQPKRRAAYLV